jgi:hypothetical protein
VSCVLFQFFLDQIPILTVHYNVWHETRVLNFWGFIWGGGLLSRTLALTRSKFVFVFLDVSSFDDESSLEDDVPDVKKRKKIPKVRGELDPLFQNHKMFQCFSWRAFIGSIKDVIILNALFELFH